VLGRGAAVLGRGAAVLEAPVGQLDHQARDTREQPGYR